MRIRIDRTKLAAELARNDMTQKQLAELAGVSKPTVNYIKNGKSCSELVAKKLADALNMPLEQLLEK